MKRVGLNKEGQKRVCRVCDYVPLIERCLLLRGSKDSVEEATATLWPLFLAMAEDGPLGSSLAGCCITARSGLVWCTRLERTLDVGEVTREDMAEEFSAENLVGVTLLSSLPVRQLFRLLLLILG